MFKGFFQIHHGIHSAITPEYAHDNCSGKYEQVDSDSLSNVVSILAAPAATPNPVVVDRRRHHSQGARAPSPNLASGARRRVKLLIKNAQLLNS